MNLRHLTPKAHIERAENHLLILALMDSDTATFALQQGTICPHT